MEVVGWREDSVGELPTGETGTVALPRKSLMIWVNGVEGSLWLTWAGGSGKLGSMKMATTAAEKRRWMEQWREAAIFLDEVKRDELASLTAQDARRQIKSVLGLPRGWRNPDEPCGLVEQQAFFHRRRRE